MAEQERVPRHSLKIAVFSSQTAGNQTCPAIQQVATANLKNGQVPQPMRILKQSDRCVENGKLRRNHVNPLDELSRPFTKMVDAQKPDEICLLRKTKLENFSKCWTHFFG